jgi:enamine deaminase RidA (YjgF/YER057c/UK114 family)
MGKRTIATERVARTKGPYVQGVAVRDCELVYVTGMVARDAAGDMVAAGDIRGQTRQCLENIRHVIEAAGGKLGDLVKLTVFIRPGTDYAGMNEVRREMLEGIQFASSTVQVGLNEPAALVEIEAVAAISTARI